MKQINRLRATSLVQFALALGLASQNIATADVVFSESFENPVVSGFQSNTIPENAKWIGSSSGPFGATNRGLHNESVIYPEVAPFTTPFGDQGYSMNYSNAYLTTGEGIFASIEAGETYTVTFNNAKADENQGGDYTVELLAYPPGAIRTALSPDEEKGEIAPTLITSKSGTVTTNDMSNTDSISYISDGTHAGVDLGFRLVGRTGHTVAYDNIRLIVSHDFAPAPASGEDLSAAGTVSLSWTNRPASSGTDVRVDIWFGSDPNPSNGSKVIDAGLNTTSTSVSAPTAGTYYWRIDTYLDSDPTGTPVQSSVYSFTIADTDGDGLPDEYEIEHSGTATGLNPGDDLENDGAGDGLTNIEEYQYDTDPNNPDSDGDNLEDGPEIKGTAGDRPATNPLLADTDGDGLDDDVETNTGTWVNASNTGTNPTDPDWDKDGLVDGVETNDNNYVGKSATGSDPYDADSDDDNVLDWYEVTASFTDPNNASEKPPLPYPLPDPDASTGATNKPVKVYILSGQSNMLGFGTVNGTGSNTLENMIKVENKFPNLVDASNDWTIREDVKYRAVLSDDLINGKLTPGNLGPNIGPELGFGYIMGYYHDEPVLIIKSSWGNRGLGWDILPSGTPSWEGLDGNETKTFAGYGEGPETRPVGDPPATDPAYWAGWEFDRFFLDESEWGVPSTPVTNVVDVLDNFSAEYPDWAGQGFEIAGFVWWQGDRDRYKEGHASKYEENLVSLIDTLRSYYSNRYPGKVVPNAPFVLATLGQTEMGVPSPRATDDLIFDAQMAVDGEAGNYPLYSGNVKTVYSHPLSQGGESSGHYNKNAVTYMMVGDALGAAMVELLEAETPPAPNPMTFEIAPSGTGATEISMVATEATSANGPVEYYFENETNGNFRDWSTDRTWTNTGLTNGQSYSYKVQVRDSNILTGEFSAAVEGTAGADSSAPSPAPTFESGPTALGEDSITMTVTKAVDINGVEYYFTCTVGGGADSGWQASRTYTPTSLSHSTEYTYTVKAKDSLGNVTADSAPASATTDSPDETPPTPAPTFETGPTALGENSITMTATTASDPSSVQYFFECTNDVTKSSNWQSSETYVATGLASNTEYTFRVRARDTSPAYNTTGYSSPASATTDAPDETAPEISTRNPANGTPGVDINSNLILTFDEDISEGTGLITIKNLSDGTQSTIEITDDTRITIIEDTLTINPSSALLESKDYAIQIAGTAIDDLVGNSFAGIGNDTGWYFTTADPPPPGLVFSEDFQSPNISGYVKKSKPDNGQWITTSSASGFGWDNHGLVDADSHASFDAAEFEAGVSEQAYALDYNGNSGLTTAIDQIGTLQAGITYTVYFDVVRDKGSDGTQDDTAYNVYLAVFDGDADRSDTQGAEKRTILATLTGSDATDAYTQKSFSYTADGTELDSLGGPAVGNDVGLVFVGSGSAAHFDNVEVVTSSSSSTVDHFAISAIGTPQTVGTPITDLNITAEDTSDQTVTDFNGTVTFGGTGGFSGTSASFTGGVLSGVSITPTNAGSDLTFTVQDGEGNMGSVTIASIQSAFSGWSNGANFDDDSNGDGISDGIAWLLGAAGPNDDVMALKPTLDLESSPGYVTFIYRSNEAAAQHLTTIVEYNNDLSSNWNAAVHDGSDIQISSTTDHYGAGIDKVEVKISKTLLPGDKLFTRLSADENP